MAPFADADVFEAGGENSYVREGYTKVAAETRQLMNNFKWARLFWGLIQHMARNTKLRERWFNVNNKKNSDTHLEIQHKSMVHFNSLNLGDV